MEAQDSLDIPALQQLILGPIPVCETFRFTRLGGAAALCLVVGLRVEDSAISNCANYADAC